MLMTLEEAKKHITGLSNEELEMRLNALELFIHSYTHNDFSEFVDEYGDIEYPVLVIMGALDLLKYDVSNSAKDMEDVASESISRHSVTYKDRSANVYGYPKNLLAFLRPYKNARF